MQIINVFLLLILIVLFMLFVLSIIAVILNHIHHKHTEELTRYSINVTSQIDGSIPQVLDLVINDCFQDYQIKNLLPMELGYINSDKEDEIRRDLAEMVTIRISSNTLQKLSQFYNIVNIADIIADKIYIKVMSYVLEHNNKLNNGEQV